MKLFNYLLTSYEELVTFYPYFYHEVYEMNEILKAEGKLLDGVKASIERIFADRFVMTADSETISVYEKIMGIRTDSSKTLEERRVLVKTLLSGSGRLSASQIKAMVKNYTGTDCEIRLEKQYADDDFDTLMINSVCGDGRDLYFDSLNTALYEKLPSHLNYHIEFSHRYGMEIFSRLIPENLAFHHRAQLRTKFVDENRRFPHDIGILSRLFREDRKHIDDIMIKSDIKPIGGEYDHDLILKTVVFYYFTPIPQAGSRVCGQNLPF